MKAKLVWFLCLCFCFSVSYAKEQTWPLMSPRALARGGAFVAAFDSDEAQRMNPATLGEADVSYQMRFLQADGFIGQNTLGTINDLMSAFSSSSVANVLSKFSDKFGEQQYIRGQMGFLAQRFWNFELFPFFSNSSWVMFTQPQVPQTKWESDTILGLMMVYGDELMKDLYWGVNVWPYQRIYLAGEIDFVDLLEFLPPSTKSIGDFVPSRTGAGLAMDFGLLWKPSANFRLGMTIHHLGGSMNFSSGPLAPPVIKQKVSLGMLHRLPVGYDFNLDTYFDLQDILNPEEHSFVRLIHTGVEVATSYISRDADFGFGMGLNDGYLSSGFFADLFVVRFDVTNYAVELGAAPGQRMDRRWSFSARSTMTF